MPRDRKGIGKTGNKQKKAHGRGAHAKYNLYKKKAKKNGAPTTVRGEAGGSRQRWVSATVGSLEEGSREEQALRQQLRTRRSPRSRG